VSVFYLRYLPPRTTGDGELVAAISTNREDWSLERWREAHPEKFEKPGFYQLLRTTDDMLTVEEPK
jgi:hypothetical protein